MQNPVQTLKSRCCVETHRRQRLQNGVKSIFDPRRKRLDLRHRCTYNLVLAEALHKCHITSFRVLLVLSFSRARETCVLRDVCCVWRVLCGALEQTFCCH